MATGKVERRSMLTYINITPNGNTKSWKLLGAGITEGSVDYGAQVEGETYIHEKTSSQEIVRYEPTMSLTAQMIADDEALVYLDDLRMHRAVLGEAATEIVNYYGYMDDRDYDAELQPVSASFDSSGGTGGEGLDFSFTLTYKGDNTLGKFDLEDKEFTAVTTRSGVSRLASPTSEKLK